MVKDPWKIDNPSEEVKLDGSPTGARGTRPTSRASFSNTGSARKADAFVCTDMFCFDGVSYGMVLFIISVGFTHRHDGTDARRQSRPWLRSP